MPYDFKYVPTSGDLSGASFESQTERAINEIGTNTETAVSIANAATDIANNASATANNALVTAESAVTTAHVANTTANNALNVAETATQTAQEAVGVANDAVGIANDAYDTAINAQSSASSSGATAESALSVAEEAKTTATTATQAAEQANLTANSALIVANKAQNPTYEVINTAIDANDYYTAITRLYVTNAESTNFPIATPLYFTVVVTDDGSSCTQTVWSAENPVPVYVRTGVINTNGSETETEEDEVLFSEWVQLDYESYLLAGEAKSEASAAKSTADSAKTLAEAAQTSADTAKARADEAYTMAEAGAGSGATSYATTDTAGIVKFATAEEARAASSIEKAISPSTLFTKSSITISSDTDIATLTRGSHFQLNNGVTMTLDNEGIVPTYTYYTGQNVGQGIMVNPNGNLYIRGNSQNIHVTAGVPFTIPNHCFFHLNKVDNTGWTLSITVTNLDYPTGTLPIANGGTGTTTAAAARTNLGVDYTISSGATGYYKLPGGLLLQWGISASMGIDANTTVTFPLAFPTACRRVIASIQNATTGNDDVFPRGSPLQLHKQYYA